MQVTLVNSYLSVLKAYWRKRYHVPYADHCQQEVGFNGKDDLEVGASPPQESVFEYLGAHSWTSPESPEYAVGNDNQIRIT